MVKLGVLAGAFSQCFAHINNLLYMSPISRAGVVVSKKCQKLLAGKGKDIINNVDIQTINNIYVLYASNERREGSAGHNE